MSFIDATISLPSRVTVRSNEKKVVKSGWAPACVAGVSAGGGGSGSPFIIALNQSSRYGAGA
ncbi:hypothetical protein [Conexibacter arvalis]|uniref:hypothetical protein n=1 Tax=Conexibacter arvalis TaxID=912552 RepID=UPI00161F08F2|nr:hypothetical protein [Conexibacter arvalis]